jgi:hypothetical protein
MLKNHLITFPRHLALSGGLGVKKGSGLRAQSAELRAQVKTVDSR